MDLTTFNVLSTHLSSAKTFPNNDPDHLNPENRLNKLKSMLSIWFQQKRVVCLQEVSLQAENILVPFLQQNGYMYASALYGSNFDGNMGVMTAWPTDLFSCEQVYSPNAREMRRWPSGPKPSKLQKMLGTIKRHAVSWLTWRPLQRWDDEDDPFVLCQYRSNRVLLTKLKHNSTEKMITVANYHAPCMFKKPPCMVIHPILTAQTVQKFAEDTPIAFAGDFNLKPGDDGYLALSGDEINPDLLQYREYDEWRPTLDPPFVSAYKQVMGEEPATTNHCMNSISNPQADKLFSATLDYVWIQGNIYCSSAQPAPGVPKDELEIQPSENNPSDHFPVHVSLRFN